MTRTFDPVAERDSTAWPLLAATILGIQGLSTIFYAAFLPTPLTGAGVEVPVLGTMPYVWIIVGTMALVAGVGVAARKTWGRYLGSAAALVAIASGLFNTQTLTPLVFILPGIVLFALWRKWPTTRTEASGEPFLAVCAHRYG